MVFKVTSEEISLLKNLIASRADVRQLQTTNPYEVFRAEYEGCLIVGYTTGKIVANKEIARKLIAEILPKLAVGKMDYKVIGSDEAGKGEWLGPMVVAAVAVRPDQYYRLQTQGVMDSKELTLQRIKELASFIRDNHYLRTHVIITPKRFNELYAKIKDERRTLNDLLAWGHSAAIKDLLRSVRKDNEKIRILIDEFDRIRTEQHLQSILSMDNVEVIQYPKAEENMAVAVASIIARDLREDYIDTLCKRLQMDLRHLTVESALRDRNAAEYAKLSYLSKLGKNESSR